MGDRHISCPNCQTVWTDLSLGRHRCSCGVGFTVKNSSSDGPIGVGIDISGMRGSVLIEAHKTINGERQDVYGSPEDSFKLIADYWTTYLRSTIEKDKRSYFTPSDVAMMMTLFKIAREANQHKRDNCIDAVGYLGIYADMQDGDK